MKSLALAFIFLFAATLSADSQSLSDFDLGTAQANESPKYRIEKRHNFQPDARDRALFKGLSQENEQMNENVDMSDLVRALEFAAGPNWQNEYELPAEELSLAEFVHFTAELNQRNLRMANEDIIQEGKNRRWGSDYGYSEHAAEHAVEHAYYPGEGEGEHYGSYNGKFRGPGYCFCHGTKQKFGGWGSTENQQFWGVRLFQAVQQPGEHYKRWEDMPSHGYSESHEYGYGYHGEEHGYGEEYGYHAESHESYYKPPPPPPAVPQDCLLADPYGYSMSHCCHGFCVVDSVDYHEHAYPDPAMPLPYCDADAGNSYVNNEFECIQPCDTSECPCEMIAAEIADRQGGENDDEYCECANRLKAGNCKCRDIEYNDLGCSCDQLFSHANCHCGQGVDEFCECDSVWSEIDARFSDCPCSSHFHVAKYEGCTCEHGLTLCDDTCCETFGELDELCDEEHHAAWVGGDECCHNKLAKSKHVEHGSYGYGYH